MIVNNSDDSALDYVPTSVPASHSLTFTHLLVVQFLSFFPSYVLYPVCL